MINPQVAIAVVERPLRIERSRTRRAVAGAADGLAIEVIL